MIRSASDAGALYGSVTTRDAADAATEGGFSVDRGQVVLDRPIKDLGLHTVSVVLHPEVIAKITLNVARSTEEAELQASGKSIQELAAEAEAEAEFEIAELCSTKWAQPRTAKTCNFRRDPKIQTARGQPRAVFLWRRDRQTSLRQFIELPSQNWNEDDLSPCDLPTIKAVLRKTPNGNGASNE